MGMFDEVIGFCPKCDARLKFQSKAGDCVLAAYSYKEVPTEIAKDISNNTQECECGYICTIEISPQNILTVKMEVV